MAKRKTAGKEGEYRILRGISWKTDEGWENVAAGELRSDLPKEHIAGWLDVGAIEPADGEEE